MQNLSRLCGVPKTRERKALSSLTLPPFRKAPDHLQGTLFAPRGRSPPGLGGETEAARLNTSGGNGPAHWVTGSRALPDLVLGHEVHALGRGPADGLLRHGAWGLGGPGTLGHWAQRLTSPRRRVAEQRSTRRRRRRSTWRGCGRLAPRLPCAHCQSQSAAALFARLPAHLPARGCSSPSLRKTLGKPQDLTFPPPFEI